MPVPAPPTYIVRVPLEHRLRSTTSAEVDVLDADGLTVAGLALLNVGGMFVPSPVGEHWFNRTLRTKVRDGRTFGVVLQCYDLTGRPVATFVVEQD